MRIGTCLACLAGTILPTVALGAPVVYEPFNYGGTSKDLSAVTASATGLDATAYSTNSADIDYLATGLTFSNLLTSGGSAYLPYYNGTRSASVGIDANLGSGTLYGSMLYANGGAQPNGVSGLLLGSSSGIDDNSARLAVMGNESDSSGTPANIGGVRMFGTKSMGSGTEMVGDRSVTYLILFQLTNVGATSGSQTFNAWVMTAGQFDNFKAGGLTESELASATTGAAASNVLQKVTHTHTATTTNTFVLTSSDSLKLFDYRGHGQFDEIRLSGTSLDDVTPIPEPASIALLGGLLALGARRRRH